MVFGWVAGGRSGSGAGDGEFGVEARGYCTIIQCIKRKFGIFIQNLGWWKRSGAEVRGGGGWGGWREEGRGLVLGVGEFGVSVWVICTFFYCIKRKFGIFRQYRGWWDGSLSGPREWPARLKTAPFGFRRGSTPGAYRGPHGPTARSGYSRPRPA